MRRAGQLAGCASDRARQNVLYRWRAYAVLSGDPAYSRLFDAPAVERAVAEGRIPGRKEWRAAQLTALGRERDLATLIAKARELCVAPRLLSATEITRWKLDPPPSVGGLRDELIRTLDRYQWRSSSPLSKDQIVHALIAVLQARAG